MSDEEPNPAGYVHVDLSRASMPIDYQDGAGPVLEAVIYFSGYWVGVDSPCENHLTFLSNHVDEIKLILDSGNVRVEGFASNTGSAAFNQGLSQHRANIVKLWLTNYGVEGEKIVEDQGLGKLRPDQPAVEDWRARMVKIIVRCNPDNGGFDMQRFSGSWEADPLKETAAPPDDNP